MFTRLNQTNLTVAEIISLLNSESKDISWGLLLNELGTHYLNGNEEAEMHLLSLLNDLDGMPPYAHVMDNTFIVLSYLILKPSIVGSKTLLEFGMKLENILVVEASKKMVDSFIKMAQA